MNKMQYPESGRMPSSWSRLKKLVPGGLVVILFALAACMLLFITGESARLKEEKLAETKKGPPPVNVVVQELIPGTMKDSISLPGVIEPWVRLNLLAEIRGSIVEVPAEEGDFVKDGDIIARIDERDYRIQVNSARASRDLAAADLERARDLFERGLIPKAEFDSKKTNAATLEAALENAELQLERCTIRAPFSAVINRLDAEKGLLLSVGDPVAEILDIARVKAVIGIPESDVDAVRRLRRVNLSIQALDGRDVTGTVHFLSRSPENLARLYRLEVKLDNPRAEILPGMFVRAGIVKKEIPDAVAVPLYSVISRSEGQFVYVANDGKAIRRDVELGILEGWRIQVAKGLDRGDRVIVVGHRDVEDGQEVKVVRSVSDPEELIK